MLVIHRKTISVSSLSMMTEPTISCNTEPKCVNPNSGKVVNIVLLAVIWNALSESDASWQMKKYYSILNHSLWKKYVLRKLLMFSLAFMQTKLNSLGFSVYFLYNNSLNKLCSSKDKIYKLAGMICQRFLCAFSAWRIWGPYTESNIASENTFWVPNFRHVLWVSFLHTRKLHT